MQRKNPRHGPTAVLVSTDARGVSPKAWADCCTCLNGRPWCLTQGMGRLLYLSQRTPVVSHPRHGPTAVLVSTDARGVSPKAWADCCTCLNGRPWCLTQGMGRLLYLSQRTPVVSHPRHGPTAVLVSTDARGVLPKAWADCCTCLNGRPWCLTQGMGRLLYLSQRTPVVSHPRHGPTAVLVSTDARGVSPKARADCCTCLNGRPWCLTQDTGRLLYLSQRTPVVSHPRHGPTAVLVSTDARGVSPKAWADCCTCLNGRPWCLTQGMGRLLYLSQRTPVVSHPRHGPTAVLVSTDARGVSPKAWVDCCTCLNGRPWCLTQDTGRLLYLSCQQRSDLLRRQC